MKHELPPLPYEPAALEPFIDAQTMEIHHGKHHAAYVAKLNEALEKHPEFADKPLEELLMGIESLPEDLKKPVRNHGGGHYNHSLFWQMLGPAGNGEMPGVIGQHLTETFGEIANFKEEFGKAAANHFGSGWAWLAVGPEGRLRIVSLPNQDAPIMAGLRPVLGLDVWEHAYYLKYQNRRAEYIEAFWNVVNWSQVEKNLQAALRK